MSYHSSCLVKHFHFLLCDPIKIAGCSLPVNSPEQSWHSHAMSSSVFSIFTPYFILGFFTNWTLICSWSLPAGLLGNPEQHFQVSLGRAALCSACSHSSSMLLASAFGAVWVYGVRGSLFFWRMLPFPQHSPGCGQGCVGHHPERWRCSFWWVASGTCLLMLRWSVLVSREINVPLQARLRRSRSEF